MQCEELSIQKFVLSQDGETALMWAAHNGHYNTCKLLLKCGANINLQDTVSVLLNLLQQFCMLFLWGKGSGRNGFFGIEPYGTCNCSALL